MNSQIKQLHILLTLFSVDVIVITIERFSFTTQVLLPPYNFIRLHELNQTYIFVLFAVIVHVLLLRLLSKNFELLKTRKGFGWLILFIIGIFLYASGEAWHEVTSFLFNTYCHAKTIGELCNGLFINDYYFGNMSFFIGGILMFLPLFVFERKNPTTHSTRNDILLLVINAIIYSFGIFAYAAFDRVYLGFFNALLSMILALVVLFSAKRPFRQYPFILYSAISYAIGVLASLPFRFH